jgi:hypothetical protein
VLGRGNNPSSNPGEGEKASSLRAGFVGFWRWKPAHFHWAFLDTSDGDTLLDHDVDQKHLEEEAQKLVDLPPVQFAGFIMTMMFSKILHPRGIRNMTVIVDSSVISIGEKDFMQNIRDARTSLNGEIAKNKGKS